MTGTCDLCGHIAQVKQMSGLLFCVDYVACYGRYRADKSERVGAVVDAAVMVENEIEQTRMVKNGQRFNG